jgi:nicotinamide-nucleotide amidase
VFSPGAADSYAALEGVLLERFGPRVFSRDGSTIDDIVAGLLVGPPVRTVAVGESCTGGLMAGRLTDRAGSSAYVLGGVVAYSNEAKVAHAGVPAELISRFGAVSPQVAAALAAGAARRFEADVGIGITGIAGPSGGTPEKPVGTVCVCVADGAGEVLIDRTVRMPGDRTAVRERTTTLAMHLLRRALLGADARPSSAA